MFNERERSDAETRPVSWYDPAWKKRKRLVLPGELIPGSLDEFPLLVGFGNDPDLARHARPDGRDILFTAGDGTTRLSHQRVVHQRLLRDQGVWTIWTGPRALRHEGRHDRTYVAYYTTNQGWWISSYDHTDKVWQHFQLRSHEASAGGRWWDDHNNPAITIRADGRLVVVYGEHSTERSWCRISTHPEDITAWGPEIPFEQEQRIASLRNFFPFRFAARLLAKLRLRKRSRAYRPAYSYVNLYTLPDGRLWRQYRPLRGWEGLSRSPSFLISEDGGETWGRPVRFLESESRTPYLVTAQQGHEIHFLFSDAHPDEWDRTSIYHAYYDSSDETYRRSDGTLICDDNGLPFSPGAATRIYDGVTPAGEGWAYDVAVDSDGNIAALFNVYSGELAGRASHRVHEYWYGYWNGAQWDTHRIATESDVFSAGQRRYSGGFVVDPEDLGTVYISLVDADAPGGSPTRHIWRYESPDDGVTWARTRVTSGGQGKAHSRPVVPIHRHPDLPLFWLYGHYVNYLEYWTGLAVGDHGDRLDSEHYVKLPRTPAGEDVVLYVYYDNPVADDHSFSFEDVWPSSCLFSFRGSLTQNDLRGVYCAGRDSLTVEVTAIWGSDRKGTDWTPILSEGDAESAWLMISKTADQHLEVRLAAAGGERSLVLDDLSIPRREWRNAAGSPERAVIQVRLTRDSGIEVWLNGRKSTRVGTLPGSIEGRPASGSLRTCYARHREDTPFQGWIDSLRIYERGITEDWLAMSCTAEQREGKMLRVGAQEDVERM